MLNPIKPYVYITTNTINGKKYIGVSTNKKSSYVKSYLGSGRVLKAAVAKYGINNFTKEIIKEFETDKEAREYERYLITYYGAVKNPNFYNLAPGGFGGGNYGRKMTKKQKKYLSSLYKGKKRTPEQIEKMASKLRGKKQSSEVVKNRANMMKKYYATLSPRKKLERARRISKSLTGNTLSDITKEKLSKHNARLNANNVREILTLRAQGVPYSELSKRYGINASSLCDIANKKTYKWVWK